MEYMRATISMANTRDAEILTTLGAASYRSHFSSVWTRQGLDDYVTTEYARDRIRRELTGILTYYFLSRAGGVPVGFTKVTLGQSIPLSDKAGMELEKVYLLPEFTGAGHCSALIVHTIEFAAGCSQESVWLNVLKENQSGRRLYERLGFTVTAELPFATDLREVGFWTMARQAA
jgi:diamine N-acetyltransferase